LLGSLVENLIQHVLIDKHAFPEELQYHRDCDRDRILDANMLDSIDIDLKDCWSNIHLFKKDLVHEVIEINLLILVNQRLKFFHFLIKVVLGSGI